MLITFIIIIYLLAVGIENNQDNDKIIIFLWKLLQKQNHFMRTIGSRFATPCDMVVRSDSV